MRHYDHCVTGEAKYVWWTNELLEPFHIARTYRIVFKCECCDTLHVTWSDYYSSYNERAFEI